MMVFGRERPTFVDEMISIASYCFQKISSVSIENNRSVVSIFGIFRGSFGLFYTLTGFSRHIMCVIQIWTTSTCSNAPKLVENHMSVLGGISRSHARDGNEFQTTGHCWLPAKQWDTWFLNSSKSKTRLKFRKLGMLSWSGINMPWYKFCPIWGRFGYILLTNWVFNAFYLHNSNLNYMHMLQCI